MAERDHQVSTGLAQQGGLGFGGGDDGPGFHPAFQQGRIPLGDLRRGEADDTDPEFGGLSIRVPEGPVQDHASGQQVSAIGKGRIGQHHRMIRGRDGLMQKRQPVVEVMVAHCRRVIAERVHRRDHRMRSRRRRLYGNIPQGGALKRVAIVEQKAIGVARALTLYQRGNARKPRVVAFAVGVVVERAQMCMQVRCRQ